MTEPPGVPGRGLGRLEFEPWTIGFSAGARISTVPLTLVMDWCGYWLVATEEGDDLGRHFLVLADGGLNGIW
jgi:hypothetical protein